MSPAKKITGEELKIEFAPEALAQMAADPELAAAMKDMQARFRQAQQDFHDGKYASFEEAMEAMGAIPVDEDDVPLA